MESQSESTMLSDNSIEISKRINNAAWSSGLKLPPQNPAETAPAHDNVALPDYLQCCREFLEKDEIITDSVIQKMTDYVQNDNKLKLHFPAGHRCCVTVLPFSSHGLRLPPEVIQDGNYVKFLIIDKDDRVLPGYFENKNDVFRTLPVEIQKELTFEIGNYEDEDPFKVSAADRQRIVNEVERVLKFARTIFNSGHKSAQN